jgi:glycosyltransferase involved in cell wall biosynthesis
VRPITVGSSGQRTADRFIEIRSGQYQVYQRVRRALSRQSIGTNRLGSSGWGEFAPGPSRSPRNQPEPRPVKCSIIIANYNCRDYVASAISSALAVDWPCKEVIVVDDASTDDSKSVIDTFGDQVKAYFRPKSHQLGAHKFGFEHSTGDVIILLDADDLLEPEVMREVAGVWRPGVAKVQYRLAAIDASGAQLGTAYPQFPRRDDHQKLRRAFLRTMDYTTPPGSGNAYARDFVVKAYALALPTMRWSDDVLGTLAPIMGDVVTIRKPLARYRIHGANHGAMRSLDAAKFRNRLHEDVLKAALLSDVCNSLSLPVARDPLAHSARHLQFRLASYLTERSAHPFPEDRLLRLVWRLAYSMIGSSQVRFQDKSILTIWAVACALAPPRYRQSLLEWRFAATARPAVLRRLLVILTSLRTHRLPDRT